MLRCQAKVQYRLVCFVLGSFVLGSTLCCIAIVMIINVLIDIRPMPLHAFANSSYLARVGPRLGLALSRNPSVPLWTPPQQGCDHLGGDQSPPSLQHHSS